MPRSKKVSEQMRAESRARILAAARRLFAEQGYFTCKVSDIAREADMSQGNIYWYFSSKEEILKAILAEGFAAVQTILQQARSFPGTGTDKLIDAVERYIVLGRDGSDFLTISMSLLAHGGMSFLRELGFDTAQIGMSYHQHLSAIIAQAQSEESVADVTPEVLTMFFFAFFNGMILTYAEDWLHIPHELVRDAVLRMLGCTVS